MSGWTVAIVVLVVALLIPTIVVIRDAIRFRRGAAMARARSPASVSGEGLIEQMDRRVAALEDEVDELHRAVQELRDETDALRTLMQGRRSER